jgi:hypothetical protein
MCLPDSQLVKKVKFTALYFSPLLVAILQLFSIVHNSQLSKKSFFKYKLRNYV